MEDQFGTPDRSAGSSAAFSSTLEAGHDTFSDAETLLFGNDRQDGNYGIAKDPARIQVGFGKGAEAHAGFIQPFQVHMRFIDAFPAETIQGTLHLSLWLCSTLGQKFYYTTLMMGNDTIQIKGDIKDMPFDLAITGSKTQDDHNMLIDLTKAGFKKRNQLMEDYVALKGDSVKIKSKQIWKT